MYVYVEVVAEQRSSRTISVFHWLCASLSFYSGGGSAQPIRRVVVAAADAAAKRQRELSEAHN